MGQKLFGFDFFLKTGRRIPALVNSDSKNVQVAFYSNAKLVPYLDVGTIFNFEQ